MPYYFLIALEENRWTFPRVLVQSVTQTASCKILNHVADSISYDDNYYIKYALHWKSVMKKYM